MEFFSSSLINLLIVPGISLIVLGILIFYYFFKYHHNINPLQKHEFGASLVIIILELIIVNIIIELAIMLGYWLRQRQIIELSNVDILQWLLLIIVFFSIVAMINDSIPDEEKVTNEKHQPSKFKRFDQKIDHIGVISFIISFGILLGLLLVFSVNAFHVSQHQFMIQKQHHMSRLNNQKQTLVTNDRKLNQNITQTLSHMKQLTKDSNQYRHYQVIYYQDLHQLTENKTKLKRVERQIFTDN